MNSGGSADPSSAVLLAAGRLGVGTDVVRAGGVGRLSVRGTAAVPRVSGLPSRRAEGRRRASEGAVQPARDGGSIARPHAARTALSRVVVKLASTLVTWTPVSPPLGCAGAHAGVHALLEGGQREQLGQAAAGNLCRQRVFDGQCGGVERRVLLGDDGRVEVRADRGCHDVNGMPSLVAADTTSGISAGRIDTVMARSRRAA